MKRFKINKYILLLLLVFALAFLSLWKFQSREYSIYIDDALNTSSRISVYGKNARQTAEGCREIIRRYDSLLSVSDPNSEIYGFNSSEGMYSFSTEVFSLIAACEPFYIDTNARFDITVGAVSQLWSSSILSSRLPDSAAVASAAALTDYSSLILNKDNHSIVKTINGQQLNLGAVAKGYISDRIAEYLKSSSVNGALADLGGNIYAFGSKNDGSRWKIGIQNPDDSSAIIGTVSIDEGYVITSGDYQRYMLIDGIRYHHIIDAKTGYPAKSGLRSVTIISDNGFIGDALSTACFIAGLEKGTELAKKYSTKAIFITEDNKVIYSKELENVFNPSDNSFIYSVFE